MAPLTKRLKELPGFVAASPHARTIKCRTDKVFLQKVNDFVIRKNGRTARDAIVSDTAQRVPIHCPDEQRTVLLFGLIACFKKIRIPVDLLPFLGRRVANDELVQHREVFAGLDS